MSVQKHIEDLIEEILGKVVGGRCEEKKVVEERYGGKDVSEKMKLAGGGGSKMPVPKGKFPEGNTLGRRRGKDIRSGIRTT